VRALARFRVGSLLLVVGTACLGESDVPLDAFPDRTGSLDLSRPLAIGDGYLAGVQDGALFESGQETSIPALLAGLAGTTDFVQPLVADPGFAIHGENGGRLALVQVAPPVIERRPRGGPPLQPGLSRPYNNLGVPGALAFEAGATRSSATSATGNLFYDLVLRDRGTFAQEAAALDPTFILVWLGTTDVLDYAAAGGDPAVAPGLPTSPATFEGVVGPLLDQLVQLTDDIAVFNVPDVTLFPFLHAVPPIVIDPLTGEPRTITIFEEVVDPASGDTLLVQRQVPVPLIGPDGPLGPGDLVTLEAGPLTEEGIGVPIEQDGLGIPLPDRVVLDVGEQFVVRDAVVGYNLALERLTEARGLALVDAHGLVQDLSRTEGVVSDGVRLGDEWLTGQAFGLDGVSFTAKGYGLLTNLLVDVLNGRAGSRLPHVRTALLPGVSLLEPAEP
jgi:hypothetical protein